MLVNPLTDNELIELTFKTLEDSKHCYKYLLTPYNNHIVTVKRAINFIENWGSETIIDVKIERSEIDEHLRQLLQIK